MKKIIFIIFLLFSSLGIAQEKGVHNINFHDVPAIEFIRFVSKISKENFIFDHNELGFTITLSSGKPLTSNEVVGALIRMLRMHGFAVQEDGSYFVIHKLTQEELRSGAHLVSEPAPAPPPMMEPLFAGELQPAIVDEDLEFATYKLRYHQGDEIQGALQKIAADLGGRRSKPLKLIEAIQTIQWVNVTNSLFFSGDEKTVAALDRLIRTLDVPRRQVFMEVLVVETDAKRSTDFGLQWVGGGTFKDKITFGAGNFAPKGSAFGSQVSESGLSGLGKIPLGKGFDLGIIGDVLLHKGKTFLSLGSLVSALELDRDTSIVLNQKIITQDNKNSKIFEGENIPFTGSVVQTVGASQQTTSNIEYRDVGVNLSITPMLGEDDVITLDIQQEITEAINDPMTVNAEIDGIRTTKTNMATHAHVPNDHFLVLSGTARNARSYQRAGIPCLGGLPLIGAAFSNNRRLTEKRNVLIFVRPHIIDTFEDYTALSRAERKPLADSHFDRVHSEEVD